MPLYHYTDDEHHQQILDSCGVLQPMIRLVTPKQAHVLMRFRVARFTAQMIWLTTNEHVTWLNANSVGLTRNHIKSDRTRHRWQIDIKDDDKIVSWAHVRRIWPDEIVDGLESTPGARPETWWLARGPLFAHYAPHRVLV